MCLHHAAVYKKLNIIFFWKQRLEKNGITLEESWGYLTMQAGNVAHSLFKDCVFFFIFFLKDEEGSWAMHLLEKQNPIREPFRSCTLIDVFDCASFSCSTAERKCKMRGRGLSLVLNKYLKEAPDVPFFPCLACLHYQFGHTERPFPLCH